MTSHRLTALGVSVASVCVALLATACSIGGNSGTMTSQPENTPSSPSSSSTAQQENDDELQTLGPLGELTNADLASAHERAIDFLRAFASTDREPSTWWAGIQPLLSPSAAEDYSYVDPAEVPTFQVQVDQVQDFPGGSSALVQVQVATSLGNYVVSLTRTSVTDPWLVSRCDPPADAQ
ncbi:hypothetical protein [Kineococcus sp. R86509]|uniref:hypothetical protein n=1 Tax=Kineococcus sp. R86509 TaxID=3093851 RepID=UPI0036D24599